MRARRGGDVTVSWAEHQTPARREYCYYLSTLQPQVTSEVEPHFDRLDELAAGIQEVWDGSDAASSPDVRHRRLALQGVHAWASSGPMVADSDFDVDDADRTRLPQDARLRLPPLGALLAMRAVGDREISV